MFSKSSFDYDSDLWWNVFWFIANAVIIGRRGYIFYKEEGLLASKKFALRADSLPYVSLWAIFAIATVVFGVLAGDEGEFVNAVGVLIAEFAAICLWWHYYGNGELVSRVVKEARERLQFLLIQGLGMNQIEREQFLEALEIAIVDLWTKRLKEKNWSARNDEEKDELLFATGLECGKVLEKQWEGVLYDVAAFFHEWRAAVETLRGKVRVPQHIASSMLRGNDAESQSLLCVAVLVANEDCELRRSRVGDEQDFAERQFNAARIARRKTAGEGILRWPDALSSASKVHISSVELNTDELYLVNGPHEYLINATDLPYSVMYTLYEIVRAGYIKIRPDGTVQASITFKYGNMVFDKDQWNPLRTIERKPFRYVTSATWMAGHMAFVVEQREINGSAAIGDGSGYLKGILKFNAIVEEVGDGQPWVTRTEPVKNTETVWGNLHGVTNPKPTFFFNRPFLWVIKATMCLLRFSSRLLRVIESIVHHPTSLTRMRQSMCKTGDISCDGAGKIINNASQKDKQSRIISQASAMLKDQYIVSRKISDSSHATTSANGSTSNNCSTEV